MINEAVIDGESIDARFDLEKFANDVKQSFERGEQISAASMKTLLLRNTKAGGSMLGTSTHNEDVPAGEHIGTEIMATNSLSQDMSDLTTQPNQHEETQVQHRDNGADARQSCAQADDGVALATTNESNRAGARDDCDSSSNDSHYNYAGTNNQPSAGNAKTPGAYKLFYCVL
jgi:hypothetical protein